MSVKQEVIWEVAKNRIRHLSPQQSKVLCVLYDHPNSCNKEIARWGFIAENSVSTTLASLRDLGIVDKCKLDIQGLKNRSLWSITDIDILNALALNSRETPNWF